MKENDFAALEARLEAQLAHIRHLRVLSELTAPHEPAIGGDCAVVTFVKRYGHTEGKAYHFASVGVLYDTGRFKRTPHGVRQPVTEQRWSITGQTDLTMVSWDQLIKFVKSDEGIHAQAALDSIVQVQ